MAKSLDDHPLAFRQVKMSTKICVAYKLVRASMLWPLVHDIKEQGTKNVVKVLKEIYADIIPDIDTTTDEFKSRLAQRMEHTAFPEYEHELEVIHLASKAIQAGYKRDSVGLERTPFTFDVSVGFRQRKGQIYVIPYCDMFMGKTLDFLKKDPRLVDFHYQNQVDKPDTISNREWAHRAKVWNDIDKTWQEVLCLDLCKYSFFYQLDPHLDMIREVIKKANEEHPKPVSTEP